MIIFRCVVFVVLLLLSIRSGFYMGYWAYHGMEHEALGEDPCVAGSRKLLHHLVTVAVGLLGLLFLYGWAVL